MNQKSQRAALRGGAAIAMLAMVAMPGQGIAQTVEDAESDPDGDVFTLSPFEVSAADSSGYQPKNTNSVTGINQALKDLPFNIEIMGQDFIDEIGADDLNSVVQFATNVNATEDEDGLQRTASFRGITSNFTRRNQYVWYNPSDSFSLGRVEIIRGPSSLLYGQGEPGGLVNSQSKQAVADRAFGSVTNTLSSWGQFRNTVDVNVHAGDRLGVRFAGVYEDSDTWRDDLYRQVKGGFLNAKYYFTKTSTVSAEYERVKREDNPSSGILMWNPSPAEWTRPADVPQSGNVQLHLLGGLSNPAVADGAITKDNAQAWSGANRPRTREWEVYQVTFDHKFSDRFSLQAGYNQQDQETLVTGTQGFSQLLSPNLSNASTLDDDWRITMLQKSTPSYNTVKTSRLRGVYNFDLGESHHDFVFGAVHRTDYFDYYDYQPRLDNGNETGGALRPQEIFYIKDGLPTSFPDMPTNPVSNPDSRGYVMKAQTRLENEETLKAGYGVLMSRLMDDRIHTLVGYRYDDLYKYDIFGDGVQYEGKEGSLSAGINFDFTDQLTGYFNYSESFKAPGAFRADFDNISLDPALGSGEEIGLKFDLFEDKVSGLVTFFRTDFAGDAVNTGGANSVVRNTVDAAGLNGRHGGFWVPTDTHSEGMELQFTAKVSKEWSFTFGYGYADARSENDVAYQLNWNDGYLADANGNPLDADGSPLMLSGVAVTKADIELDDLGNIANWADLGLVGNGVTGAKVNQVTGQPTATYVVLGGNEKTGQRNEHNVNLSTRYVFKEGSFKGLSIGANARTGFNYLRGYTGSVVDGDRVLVLGDDFYVDWGLWAAYTKNFEKFRWTTRVLIDNPFDDEYTLGGYNNERWNNPRQFRWTNTIGF